jgi:hypothetical protein
MADPFLLAADMLDPPGGGVEKYFSDPVGFARDCIRWENGKGPTVYQERHMDLLVKAGRVCERGPHGLGKTCTKAWLILWFALTRDARGVDWKVISTASAWRQLEKYLWPEVRKWSMKLRWGVIGRQPFSTTELMRLGLRLNHGEAIAVACEDPATIEGAHADSMLYIYDEAKTIPAATFDASEGAFSGAGEDTDQEAFAFVSSTPGLPTGRFHQIQVRKPGTEDWTAVHVTKEEVIAAGRMSTKWASARRTQWGSDSAVYINRVEGDFASSESNGVIPLSWVEKANERFLDWATEGLDLPEHTSAAVPTARVAMEGVHAVRLDYDEKLVKQLTAVGADIAESGGDKTILALRYGMVIGEIRRCPRGDVMAATGYLMQVMNGVEEQPAALVDAIGLGAGVVARAREQGALVVAFKASEKTEYRDRSGELEFYNKRSAAWWHMRELLDPANGHEVGLPPDDQLTGDLTAPKREDQHSSGKVAVETKEKLKERLGRSTDTADAVVQAFWWGATGIASAPILKRRPGGSRWGGMHPQPAMSGTRGAGRRRSWSDAYSSPNEVREVGIAGMQ